MNTFFNRSDLQNFIENNQNTVGYAFKSSIALALLKEFESLGGKGIAAPSANRFGAVSPTTAQAVKDELENYLDQSNDIILDGGSCQVGVESAIIDCTAQTPQILRLGAITKEMIQESTGLLVIDEAPTDIRVSGSLESLLLCQSNLDPIPQGRALSQSINPKPHQVLRTILLKVCARSYSALFRQANKFVSSNPSRPEQIPTLNAQLLNIDKAISGKAPRNEFFQVALQSKPHGTVNNSYIVGSASHLQPNPL